MIMATRLFHQVGRAVLTVSLCLTLMHASGIASASGAPHRLSGTVWTHAASIPVRCPKHNRATGTIKYSDWQFPDTLNPYQTQSSATAQTDYNLIKGLVLFDQRAHLRPDMLAHLPVASGGGLTYTATLKPGLRWSNGQEITAADVKFGWEIGMHPDSGPYCPAVGCDVISHITTSGQYTVVWHLKHVYAPFVLNTLSFLPVWPIAWSAAWSRGNVKEATDKLFQDSSFNFENSDAPTNGAYQVANFVMNDRIVLHPMRFYGTMTCGAKVQTMLFVFYSSKPDLIAAATSKETDTTTDYTEADLPELLQHKANFKTYVVPAFFLEHLTFNIDPTYHGQTNPLHNPKVRLALALALDKIGLLQGALGIPRGQAQRVVAWTPLLITKGLVQPFADTAIKGQWDPLAHRYIADTGHGTALSDARKLLAQAGYKSGFSLEGVTTSGNPVRTAEFSIMEANWARIGVQFQPTYIPATVLFSDWDHGSPRHTGDFQVVMYTDTGYPDPDALKADFQSTFIDRDKTVHSAINTNYGGIRDPLIDEAFNRGASTLDPSVRRRWYSAWQVQVNKKAYWVPLYYRYLISTSDGRIGNWKTNPTATGQEWNSFEWYVRGSS
jgi:peptide/nickel transport system substrate-binding protein